MTFEGALITEQGVTFAIVIVKPHVVQNRIEANRTIQAFAPTFGGVPTVLMAQNGQGVPTYFGRRDIVNFLAHVHPAQIPWKRYTLS